MTRRGHAAAAAIALLALLEGGCGEPRSSQLPIRIAAPGSGAATDLPMDARWDRDGATAPITLSAGTRQGPWTTVAVTTGDGQPAGTLLRGPAAAVLGYQAAVSTPSFAGALLPSRLALVARELSGGPVQPALWLATPLRVEGAARGVPLEALSVDEAAPLLATAMALGGWQALALDRFPRGDDGRPRLPPFVPVLPGKWGDLRGTSLEGFLEAEMAERIAETPGLRAQTQLLLGRLLPQIDQLVRSIDALAASIPDLPPRTGLDALTGLLAEHAEALGTYLDSSWVEQVVSQTGPDRIRMTVDVHSVVPVDVEAFAVAFDHRRVLAQGEALGALRLIDRDSGDSIPLRIAGDRIVFPVNRAVEPVALGPYRFGSTRLAYEIRGLEEMPALRDRMLEDLDVRVVRHDGKPVAGDHLRRIWTVSDRRFSAAREESPQNFAASLADRVSSLPGAPAPRLADGVLRFRGGVHHLHGDLILPPGIGLWIEAGTELRVDPGRSILVRGALRIEGRPGSPVRIGRADESAPWGVLAAQGLGVTRAGGSPRLRAVVHHLELDGGSEDQLRGVWYTGQLSIYHQDLELSDSTLSRSSNQDNLNVNRGTVEIHDCRFLASGDDAVDLDWATGTLRRSLLSGGGPDGDGVDVAGSTLRIEDVVIGDTGDKCISAGERSKVEAKGVLMRRCDAAIASKDSSRVNVEESVVLDVGTGYDAYQKSDIFGPPTLRVDGVIAAGLSRPVRTTEGAVVEVHDLIEITPTPPTAPGVRVIRLPPESALGRALSEDALRRTEHFDAAGYEALRALAPEDARPR